ncbi:MAG: fused response regulator/phosphatase [Candidatus Rifleibacteriota bacterium]
MNILVVDDAIDNLMLLEAILEPEGFNSISLASSAREAYEKLENAKGNQEIDLILMDIMMPEISGIEAIREIRSKPRYQDIPILVVSARSETKALVEAFEAGAVDYLTKPINEVELLVRIRSMLKLKAETDHRKFHELELEQLVRELEQKNSALQRILFEINSDLEAAGKMQRSLLPNPGLALAGFDFAYYFEPCETIGGDLLNIVPVNENEATFFILDVSGHGIQSAMLAVSVHRMLSAWGGENNIIRKATGEIRPPHKVVEELNREFLIQKSNYQYFTMIYGILNHKEKSISYCRAGHTPMLLQKLDGEIIVNDKGNIPVGLAEEGDYFELNATLEKGERAILFSDGITEARCMGEFFGDKRFYQLLAEGRSMNIKDATNHVINGLKNWMGSELPGDDISLLIFEAK